MTETNLTNELARSNGIRGQATSREITPEDIPERPSLAPNVELCGEMQEGGFAQRQFLAERDGRFVQLTELLYRVVEQADGQKTHEEMALSVSAAIDRKVSADNVRQLIAKKLIPLGLIAKADGSVAQLPNAGKAGASPLAVNMRMKMLPREYITPATAVLKHLFRPPVLILTLAAAAIANGWVFFVHGIAGATHDALYQPSLMLAVLGIIIVSTIWHEFGHAAALEYGGGRVRGMGAGLYIVYPAFYTDVTDNYRLGRWARVRTDLGGFYFNLIFTLFVLGVYFWTGQEFLLLVILLIILEIIHQLLPFVRLDGYWALADLTGIPDFFSHIGPFLRTVLPVPWWKGRRLPNLKRWVKVVFGAYIAITVPLLAFLLFMMVRSVPRILATSWDSSQLQRQAFDLARANGDSTAMAAAAVQLGILAIPTIGLIFVLYTLGKKVGLLIWRFSKPTPTRRVAGSFVTAGLVVLLAYMWVPQIPFGGESGPMYNAAAARFKPIGPKERGTLLEAIRRPDLVWRSPENEGSTAAPALVPTLNGVGSSTSVPIMPSATKANGGATPPTSVPTVPDTQPTKGSDADGNDSSSSPTVAPTESRQAEAITPSQTPADGAPLAVTPTKAAPQETPASHPTPTPGAPTEPKPTQTPRQEPTPVPTEAPAPTNAPTPTEAPTQEPAPAEAKTAPPAEETPVDAVATETT